MIGVGIKFWKASSLYDRKKGLYVLMLVLVQPPYKSPKCFDMAS